MPQPKQTTVTWTNGKKQCSCQARGQASAVSLKQSHRSGPGHTRRRRHRRRHRMQHTQALPVTTETLKQGMSPHDSAALAASGHAAARDSTVAFASASAKEVPVAQLPGRTVSRIGSKRLTWQEALRMLSDGTQATRPSKLEDVDLHINCFIEPLAPAGTNKGSRRLKGQDIWRLDGARKIPQSNPKVICRYGSVSSPSTLEVKAKVVSYQACRPSAGSDGSRLFWIERTPDFIERWRRRATKENSDLLDHFPINRSTSSNNVITMEEVEDLLQSPEELARLTCRPVAVGEAAGQLYYERKLMNRRVLRCDGETRALWRSSGGQCSASYRPSSLEPRVRRVYGSVFPSARDTTRVARYAGYTLVGADDEAETGTLFQLLPVKPAARCRPEGTQQGVPAAASGLHAGGAKRAACTESTHASKRRRSAL
eukprot:SAG22_NODE_135_length_18211_cov_560.916519_4_plen_427_part_00